MKLCIDIQALHNESAYRGIGRYTLGLTEAIVNSGRVQTSLLMNTALTEKFDEAHAIVSRWNKLSGITIFNGLEGVEGLKNENSNRLTAAAALFDAKLDQIKPDVLLTSSAFDGMGDNSIIGDRRLKISDNTFRVCTIYDLIPFENPEHYLADPRYNVWFKNRLEIVKTYDLILTISEHTKEIVNKFGILNKDKVVSISSDTSNKFKKLELSNSEITAIKEKYNISKPFIVHTGILEDRKNVSLIIKAISLLPKSLQKKIQLLLVTKFSEEQKDLLIQLAIKLGVAPDILIFSGFVEDDDLVKIYNIARGLIFPSLSEGFGLPVLEAMRCGIPALGSNVSSIPEIIGNSEFLFSPYDEKELSNKLQMLFTDEKFYKEATRNSLLRESEFSWERSANKAIDAIENGFKEHKITKKVRIESGFPLIGNVKINSYPWGTQNSSSDIEKSYIKKIKGVNLNICIIRNSKLTKEQQDLILSGAPFGAVFIGKDQIFEVTQDIAYLASGFSYLAMNKSSIYKIEVKDLANLSNIYSYEIIDNQNDLETSIVNVSKQMEENFAGINSLVISKAEYSLDDQIDVSILARTGLFPESRIKTIFVDITELVKHDARTGIQRVVRSILFELLKKRSPELRIEPIYRDIDRYKYARSFISNFLEIPSLNLPDNYVTFLKNDVFLGLDLDALINQTTLSRLKRYRQRGVKLIWILYDILPMTNPEWFHSGIKNAVSDWINKIVEEANCIISISKFVADELIRVIPEIKPNRILPLSVSWWHLGGDIESSVPTNGLSEFDLIKLDKISDGVPVFLTVGTIEPRKGLIQTLKAFNLLWNDGVEVQWVIVGKKGWHMEELVKDIENHKELNKKLLWFSEASDELLDLLYKRATVALLPSEGEGFGLPLVEAARNSVPIMARNLDVFREISGENAFYFTGKTNKIFAKEILEWIKLYKESRHPLPNFKPLTWAESAEDLLENILSQSEYKKIDFTK